jgi:hypothetical protein
MDTVLLSSDIWLNTFARKKYTFNVLPYLRLQLTNVAIAVPQPGNIDNNIDLSCLHNIKMLVALRIDRNSKIEFSTRLK